eukprot:7904979-Pyramimonas_sp.AAC.1
MGAPMAGHFIRTAASLIAKKGKSTLMIYVDLKNPFYMIIRPMGVAMDHCEEDIEEIRQRSTMPQQFRPLLEIALAAPPA